MDQDWVPIVIKKKATPADKRAERAERVEKGELPPKSILSEETARLFEAAQAEGPGQVPTPPKTLQMTVQEKRIAKGWNRKNLAFHAGLKEQVIEACETGKGVITPTELNKIGKALGVDLRPLAKGKKDNIDHI